MYRFGIPCCYRFHMCHIVSEEVYVGIDRSRHIKCDSGKNCIFGSFSLSGIFTGNIDPCEFKAGFGPIHLRTGPTVGKCYSRRSEIRIELENIHTEFLDLTDALNIKTVFAAHRYRFVTFQNDRSCFLRFIFHTEIACFRCGVLESVIHRDLHRMQTVCQYLFRTCRKVTAVTAEIISVYLELRCHCIDSGSIHALRVIKVCPKLNVFAVNNRRIRRIGA